MRDLAWINHDNESDGVPALDTHNLTGRARNMEAFVMDLALIGDIDDDLPLIDDPEYPLDDFGYIGDECG